MEILVLRVVAFIATLFRDAWALALTPLMLVVVLLAIRDQYGRRASWDRP